MPGPVTLKRPRHGSAKTNPETVSMTLVEAREINPPANEEPLQWRLLTDDRGSRSRHGVRNGAVISPEVADRRGVSRVEK